MYEKRRLLAGLVEILSTPCDISGCASVLARGGLRAAPLRSLKRNKPQHRPTLVLDANDYPGDDALVGLRRTFTFSGYWLNPPPGAKTNSWIGKRAALLKNGFGFLILFNGRLSMELQPPGWILVDLGARDAENCGRGGATRSDFSGGTSKVIYLDIDEGGTNASGAA